MSDYYDSHGYEDCVMNSSDDYEPYGYLSPQHQQGAQQQQGYREQALPQLQLHQAALAPDQRNARFDPRFDRVIEAQILAQRTMLGC
jgi:hypothetical protein